MKNKVKVGLSLHFLFSSCILMQAMKESPVLPFFLRKHVQKNNIREQKLKKKINQKVENYTQQLEAPEENIDIQKANDSTTVIPDQNYDHIRNSQDFSKTIKLYKMTSRRKNIKPKEKIEPLSLLKETYELHKNNVFIALSFNLLKEYTILEDAPPHTIKQAATFISLDNIPEEQKEKKFNNKVGTLRHAFQQELNKRSNVCSMVTRYIQLQSTHNPTILEKELNILKEYIHKKINNKQYDFNQKIYIKLLYTILDTTKELPDTENIQYAIEQRLAWYNSYNITTKN